MNLDELKETWAQQDQRLDTCIRVNRELLVATMMNRVQAPLRRLIFFLSVEVLLGLAATVVLGRFIYDHLGELRFALPAVALDIWMIANVAAAIRQMVDIHAINYDAPVAIVQQQLEDLRILRIRILKWALLTGLLVWWVPFLIVALKGLFGADAYRLLGIRYISVNLLISIAIIPATIWISKQYANCVTRSPIVQRLMRDLAGYNLNKAAEFLAILSEFNHEGREN